MSRDARLTSWQAFCLTIRPMIATGVFSLARITTDKAGRDAWLSVLLAGLLALVSMSLILAVMLRHPGKNIWQLTEDLFGRALAKGVAFLYVAFYWVGGTVAARMFWELVGSVVMRRTPPWVLLSMTGLVVTYALSLGLSAIARFSELTVWVLLALSILAFPLQQGIQWANILPIGCDGLMPILSGVSPALFSFYGFEAIIVFNHAFAGLRPKRLAVACLGGVALATILYAVSVITVLLTFGPEWTKKIVWPILHLLKIIRLPVASRMERPFIFFWAAQVYGTVMILLAVVASGASYLVPSKAVRGFLPVIIGLPVAASGLMQLPISRLMELADRVGRLSLLFMFAIPALMMAVSLFRHKDGGS